jgi:hypothetical protein
MQTLRHIGKFVKENEQIIARLDNLGLDYDIVPVANLSFRDAIIERAPYHTYGLTESLGDTYLTIPEIAMPERLMWCDCHKHARVQNKVRNDFKDYTRAELNTIWASVTRYTVEDELQKQFPHSYSHKTDYIYHSVCINRSLNESPKVESPNKWHLKAVFFDTEGNPYETWYYPNDLVVRIPLEENMPNSNNRISNSYYLTTLSTWDSYRNMEDFGTMTMEEFHDEVSRNWTWDIDNPKVCFADNCKDYNEYEDYLPNIDALNDLSYKNALANLELQMQFARFYRKHEHGYEDDELQDLNQSVFSNIFDDNNQIIVDMSKTSMVEMVRRLGNTINSSKQVKDDDVVSVLIWLEMKIHQLKQAQKSKKPLSYLVENILEEKMVNKDNIYING